MNGSERDASLILISHRGSGCCEKRTEFVRCLALLLSQHQQTHTMRFFCAQWEEFRAAAWMNEIVCVCVYLNSVASNEVVYFICIYKSQSNRGRRLKNKPLDQNKWDAAGPRALGKYVLRPRTEWVRERRRRRWLSRVLISSVNALSGDNIWELNGIYIRSPRIPQVKSGRGCYWCKIKSDNNTHK